MRHSACLGTLLVIGLLWIGAGRPGIGLGGASESALGQQSGAPAAPVGRTIREAGTLTPGESVEVRNEAQQPLAILFVARPGEAVKEGDLLVELDTAPLVDKRGRQELRTRKAETELALAKEALSAAEKSAQGAVEMAEKALHLAQTQLKTFREGEYPLQLSTAEREAALANERVLLAEERVGRLKATADNEDAKARLLEVQFLCTEARAQVQVAEKKLAFLSHFVQPQRTEELELVVAQRELEVARAKDALLGASLRTRLALDLAEATYRQESDRLNRLNYVLERTKMYAPRDGIVVYPQGEPAIRPGAVAGIGQVLVRLADMKRLNVEVRTDPEVGRLLAAGQPATIRFHGLPQRTFRGHIANVRVPYSTTQDAEQRSITVQLDNPSDDLRIGMTAVIDFEVAEPSPDQKPNR